MRNQKCNRPFCWQQADLVLSDPSYIAIEKMGCLRLTYQSEILNASTGQALEKSDQFIFLAQGEKKVRPWKSYNYYPFGATFNQYSRENSVPNKYKYNGIERQEDLNLGWDLAQFRSYEPTLGRFMQIDPVIKVHESPYAWNTNNPILYPDPTGADSTQRAQAVAKAKEYVSKNNNGKGNTYGWGAKGKPGEKVDCAGLVSESIVAGGEKDPVADPNATGTGVDRLAAGSAKVDTQDAQEGNFVTLDNGNGPKSHTGMIVTVKKDANGKVTGYVIADSGGSPKNGVSGPRMTDINLGGSNYWDSRVTGVYKWDTKPDGAANSGAPQGTFIGPGPSSTFTDKMRSTGAPILRDLANIIDSILD